jgi:5-methylcytosine-specific restriction protein A
MPKTWDHNGQSAHARGLGAAWRKARALALKRDKGLCVVCWRAGRVTVASEVDHIRPRAAGQVDHALDNLQSLCRPCHDVKTRAENGCKPAPTLIGVDGWPAGR